MICHNFFQALLQPSPSLWLLLSCIGTPVNEIFRALNPPFRICHFCSFALSSAYSKKYHSTSSLTSLLRDESHRPLTRASVKGDRNLSQREVRISQHTSKFSSSASTHSSSLITAVPLTQYLYVLNLNVKAWLVSLFFSHPLLKFVG